MPFTLQCIWQVKVPVTDLERSVRWYCDLFDLHLIREFVEDDRVVGAVLEDPSGQFVISPRLRERIPGEPAMPGFDLFSVRVGELDDLRALADRCAELGVTHGEIFDRGPDGHHLDLTDPDGTNIRVLTPSRPDAPSFAGVVFAADGPPTFYDEPRLPVR